MRTSKTLLRLIVVFLMSSSVLGFVTGPDVARACPNPPTSCLTDVNGGGLTDLVFYFFHPQQGLTVRTKLSNGDGTWTSVQAVLGDGDGMSGPLAADVNGDGKTDLVFYFFHPQQGLTVRTKLSNGDGTWTSVQAILGDGYGLRGPLAAYDSGILDIDGEALPPGPNLATLDGGLGCPKTHCTVADISVYEITLDRFQIYNTMSFHEDTVYVYFHVKVGDTVYSQSAKIGNRNNGTYSLGWTFPVVIDNDNINTPVLVTYSIVNNGHDDERTQIQNQTMITVGIADGLRRITTAYPPVSAVIASIEAGLIKAGTARWLLNNFVNCDGTVLLEEIVTNGSMLRDLTSGGTYTAEPRYIERVAELF